MFFLVFITGPNLLPDRLQHALSKGTAALHFDVGKEFVHGRCMNSEKYRLLGAFESAFVLNRDLT